ncbi:MAG: ACT domain-containing protein [Clostridia bacterium]|nr:ACT domain-containing protein [Clostridia bacterium]
MRAVITVIGKDMVGILAKVSTKCAEHNINVLEVTQSILQDMFAMIMMVDIDKSDVPFTQFAEEMAAMGADMGMAIHAMHEDIFESMHRI